MNMYGMAMYGMNMYEHVWYGLVANINGTAENTGCRNLVLAQTADVN